MRPVAGRSQKCFSNAAPLGVGKCRVCGVYNKFCLGSGSFSPILISRSFVRRAELRASTAGSGGGLRTTARAEPLSPGVGGRNIVFSYPLESKITCAGRGSV